MSCVRCSHAIPRTMQSRCGHRKCIRCALWVCEIIAECNEKVPECSSQWKLCLKIEMPSSQLMFPVPVWHVPCDVWWVRYNQHTVAMLLTFLRPNSTPRSPCERAHLYPRSNAVSLCATIWLQWKTAYERAFVRCATSAWTQLLFGGAHVDVEETKCSYSVAAVSCEYTTIFSYRAAVKTVGRMLTQVVWRNIFANGKCTECSLRRETLSIHRNVLGLPRMQWLWTEIEQSEFDVNLASYTKSYFLLRSHFFPRSFFCFGGGFVLFCFV